MGVRPTISVSAGVVLDGRGRTLLVRKTGTRAFMNPGGKPEPGESAAEALCRELAEEVGLAIRPDELTYLGRYRADAANEPGHLVDADVFERGQAVAGGRDVPFYDVALHLRGRGNDHSQ
jgi:8-oxo-dGTP pyrophosphatase MutT (NUDIX family)